MADQNPNYIVPTAPPGTNDNQAASTAFVQAAVGGGGGGGLTIGTTPVAGGIVGDVLTVGAGSILAQAPAGGGGGGGIVNINSLLTTPLDPTGATSNVPQFQQLASVLQGVGIEMPVPINFTVGNPSVISINPTIPSGGTAINPLNHFLKPNQSFFVIQTSAGTLPTGLTLSTPYYIRAGTQGAADGMTPTTFTFSTTNNYGRLPGLSGFTSEGPPVVTSGTFTAGLSIVLTGTDVNLMIPPGAYFGGNFGDNSIPNVAATPNGIKRIRYWAYGAMFDTHICLGSVSQALGYNTQTWALASFDYVNTTPVNYTAQSRGFLAVLTLGTAGDAANYYPGQWVSVMSLDVQDTFGQLTSGPPNYHYQEFKQILSINLAANQITLDGPTKWMHLSTFPNLFTPLAGQVGGGRAMIVPMHPSWDTEIEVIGARWVGEATVSSARRFTYRDCVFTGYANAPGQGAPSVAQAYIYKNCVFGPGFISGAASTYMEVDKMIEYLELDGCRMLNGYILEFTSVSLQICNIRNHKGSTTSGTPRQIRISDSDFEGILIGCQLGVTDSATIINSRCVTFDMTNRYDDSDADLGPNLGLGPLVDMTLVPNWTFSNGTFTRDLSPGAGTGYIAGTTLTVVTSTGAAWGVGQRLIGAGITKNTTITALGTGLGGTGTYTVSTSQTVGSVGSPIALGSALPGQQAMSWQMPGTKCYFTDAGQNFKYYQNMGSPFAILNSYMDASGNFSFDTTLSAVPSRQTSATVTISLAAPGVVTWTAHGFPAGTPICFTTTGVLPTGLNYSTIVYVANDANLTANTFAVSDTNAHALAGTNQIATTAPQAGTHKAYGNPLCFRPHPCPRFTGLNNTGCNTIIDQNGAIDEPLFSRAKRSFVGLQNSTVFANPQGFQVPNAKVWGNLLSMTVNVIKAGTAGTLTITSPSFQQPSCLNSVSSFSQAINVAVAGKRVVTNTAVTGNQTGDTLVAFTDWLAGPLVFGWAGTPQGAANLANSPIVTLEILTDQGITRFSNMMGAPASPASGTFLWQWMDSGIVQQYGSLP